MIEVKGLSKRYGDHLAVDDLSFTVEDGRIYGFLGPNGAGKSTTMNIITDCISATEGQVIINGCDIFEEPKKAKQQIGYLPELPPLYPEFSVREYLRFVCELKKVPEKEIKAEIERVIDEANVSDVADRLIRTLSKGYRQRVGLAQALVGSPSIIILDEPSIGLDPKQIIEMRELIRGLRDKHTVILSSHILSEVSEVCDHILIIKKGVLVADGTPDELASRMESTAKIDFTARGDSDAIEAIVEAFAGVMSHKIEAGTEDGTVKGEIETDKDIDLRDELSLALAKAGCPILSMSLEKASLEDVFLDLTYNEGSEDAEDISDGEASASTEKPKEKKRLFGKKDRKTEDEE